MAARRGEKDGRSDDCGLAELVSLSVQFAQDRATTWHRQGTLPSAAEAVSLDKTTAIIQD